jgi:hypothetical protein
LVAEIVLGPLSIGTDDLHAYLAATGSRSAVYQSHNIVPAPAVAALMLREFLRRGTLPPATIQVGQSLEARRAVAVGELLTCAAHLSDAAYQATRRLLIVRFTVLDSRNNTVLEGQTHLLVPDQEGQVG